eukprot:5466146-Pyramimonas_sp.AAC.1
MYVWAHAISRVPPSARPGIGGGNGQARRKQEEGPLEATKDGNIERAWALLARARPHLLNVSVCCGFQRAFFLLPPRLLRYLAQQRVVALSR